MFAGKHVNIRGSTRWFGCSNGSICSRKRGTETEAKLETSVLLLLSPVSLVHLWISRRAELGIVTAEAASICTVLTCQTAACGRKRARICSRPEAAVEARRWMLHVNDLRCDTIVAYGPRHAVLCTYKQSGSLACLLSSLLSLVLFLGLCLVTRP